MWDTDIRPALCALFVPGSNAVPSSIARSEESNISQGAAGGDQFRTAPLWGLGQRIFFLHDGRTADVVQTIQAHGSNGNRQYQSSEANGVVNNYNHLSSSQQQDLLNFLRSL